VLSFRVRFLEPGNLPDPLSVRERGNREIPLKRKETPNAEATSDSQSSLPVTAVHSHPSDSDPDWVEQRSPRPGTPVVILDISY
jgi:hypothetical protein